MRVLAVDDDDSVLRFLEHGLVACGFRVDGATTGAEALECIARALASGDAYDALVLDWGLPDLSGAEVHLRAHRLDPALGDRTVFISGQPGLRHMHAGGRFLAKPFRLEDLERRLRNPVATAAEPTRRPADPIGTTMPGPRRRPADTPDRAS